MVITISSGPSAACHKSKLGQDGSVANLINVKLVLAPKNSVSHFLAFKEGLLMFVLSGLPQDEVVKLPRKQQYFLRLEAVSRLPGKTKILSII